MKKASVFVLLLITTVIGVLSFLKLPSASRATSFPASATRPTPSSSMFINCLLDAHRALTNLSLPWFITFGTALEYHRSSRFVSDDIDSGIFIDHFIARNISDTKLLSVARAHGFQLIFTYGNLSHGQEWTFQCPRSPLRFDIFVFYRGDTTQNETFAWWTASYYGLCDRMRHRKCRWRFSQVKLEQVRIEGENLDIVDDQFLLEQYGADYLTPKKYGYFESLKMLPNLIQEH